MTIIKTNRLSWFVSRECFTSEAEDGEWRGKRKCSCVGPEGCARVAFRLYNRSMINLIPENKHPLWMYVIPALVVWAVILAGIWFFHRERFATFVHVCGGFLLGMCAMYNAMHVYRWNSAGKAALMCGAAGLRGRGWRRQGTRCEGCCEAMLSAPWTARTPAPGNGHTHGEHATRGASDSARGRSAGSARSVAA